MRAWGGRGSDRVHLVDLNVKFGLGYCVGEEDSRLVSMEVYEYVGLGGASDGDVELGMGCG